MPIIDIQIVLAKDEALPDGLAQDLVDRLGKVLNVQQGQLWLRLQVLLTSNYAENEATLALSDLPIFVTVIHAKSPEGDELKAQASALAKTVAAVVARGRTHKSTWSTLRRAPDASRSAAALSSYDINDRESVWPAATRLGRVLQ